MAALWDFTGPAFTITSGNDGVIRAIEVAQNMLSNGEVEAVVVGGVDFSGGLENVLLRNKKHPINSSKNPSLSFNQNDDGWLIGEGAGAIVLKNQNQIAADEKVYSVIEELGDFQADLSVSYRELFASGITNEDQRELKNLIENGPEHPVALGSVKANIGHTFAASAMASIIKTTLCLHHKFIPAIPNWEAPKEANGFKNINYYFPQNSRPWIKKHSKDIRKASVHGQDGVQLKLAEGTSKVLPPALMLEKFSPKLIPLKGNSEKELLTQLNALEIALESETSFSEVAGQFYHKLKNQEQKTDFCLALISTSKKAMLREIGFFKKKSPTSI